MTKTYHKWERKFVFMTHEYMHEESLFSSLLHKPKSGPGRIGTNLRASKQIQLTFIKQIAYS